MWGSYFLDKDGVKDEKLWFGCSLKNPAFMWWVQKKPIQYRGGFPQKGGGLGQFADLRGGGLLVRKRGVFLSGRLHSCFNWKWPIVAAKYHTRQKIIRNSVTAYDILQERVFKNLWSPFMINDFQKKNCTCFG